MPTNLTMTTKLLRRQRRSIFITHYPDCFKRTCREGHITASTWIVNITNDKFLMTLHKKLKLWPPLGGHSDRDSDIHCTAFKEVQEESGLESLMFVSKNIFDICIADYVTTTEPFHQHYNLNFLLQIRDQNNATKISDESIDLRWFSDFPKQVKGIENLNRLYSKWKQWTKNKAKIKKVL